MVVSLFLQRVDALFYIMLFTLLLYLLLTMAVRALLGENIMHPQFWFYLSTWMLVFLYCTFYLQNMTMCDMICYSYWPIQSAANISLICFMHSHLKLHDPALYQGSNINMEPSKRVIYTCYSAGCLYCLFCISKTITRFWDKCWPYDVSGGCIVQINPTYFLGNIENILAMVIDAVICYQFIKTSKIILRNDEFRSLSAHWGLETQNKMLRASVTSVVMTLSNLSFYFYSAVAHTIVKQSERKHPMTMTFFEIYLYWNAANIGINVCMVMCCFPLSHHNLFHLLKMYYEKGKKDVFDLTQDHGAEDLENSLTLTQAEMEAWASLEPPPINMIEVFEQFRAGELPASWRALDMTNQNNIFVNDESSSEEGSTETSSSYGAPLIFDPATNTIRFQTVADTIGGSEHPSENASRIPTAGIGDSEYISENTNRNPTESSQRPSESGSEKSQIHVK